jgi:hypothetical protein
MSTTQPSKIDQHLLDLAAAKGLTLGSAKVDGERYFFIKDAAGELLFDGRAFDRRELVGALQGGRHED